MRPASRSLLVAPPTLLLLAALTTSPPAAGQDNPSGTADERIVYLDLDTLGVQFANSGWDLERFRGRLDEAPDESPRTGRPSRTSHTGPTEIRDRGSKRRQGQEGEQERGWTLEHRQDLVVLAEAIWKAADRNPDLAIDLEPGRNALLIRGRGGPGEDLGIRSQDQASELNAWIDDIMFLDSKCSDDSRSCLFKNQRNYPLHGSASITPDDPLFPHQWALRRVEAPEAWQTTRDQRGVVVAIIDSGVDRGNPELALNLQAVHDFRSDAPPSWCSPEPDDPTGHGTAMAGIVGAETANKLRVAGMSWDVELESYQVLGPMNRGTVWDLAPAIEAAAKSGATIISLSLGGRPKDPRPLGYLKSAIIAASSTGTLVIAAAGNDNQNLEDSPPPETRRFYPASFKTTHPCGVSENARNEQDWCFENFLVVGATDLYPGDRSRKSRHWRDRRAPFSNYGPEVVDLGAPGVAVLTTGLEKNGGVAEVTGTSASTALVAGAAALVASTEDACLQKGDMECYEAVKRRLLDGADRICQLQDCFAKGRRLNVLRAIKGESGPEGCIVQDPPENPPGPTCGSPGAQPGS